MWIILYAFLLDGVYAEQILEFEDYQTCHKTIMQMLSEDAINYPGTNKPRQIIIDCQPVIPVELVTPDKCDSYISTESMDGWALCTKNNEYVKDFQ